MCFSGEALEPALNPTFVSEGTFRNNDQHLSPNDGPQAKRRKTDTVPEWESARPQWEQELGESHARQQMNEIVQRPWATVNSPAAMSTPQTMMNGLNGSVSRTGPRGTSEQRNSMGWATVNQPVPVPGPPSFNSAAEGNGGGYRSTLEQGRREETVMNEEGSAAFIDTLPKNKQRQLYGLVSGFQNGIGQLQRELDSLKRALGIDDED